jgi:hypothetical protein
MFRKIIISVALVFLLAAAASLIAQERRDDPARRAGPPEKQLRAQNQLPAHFCPLCQCPHCQKIRQNRIQRRGDAIEGMDRPLAPRGPQQRFGRPEQPRGFQPQVGPQARLPLLNQWFEQLKQAYRENDREKMGRLLRRMEQFRNGARQALQAPEGIRPLPKEQTDIDRPSQNRDFERQPLPRQQRFRQRGPQQDFEVPAIRPGLGPQEQENLPVPPERQRRLRQDRPSIDDRPLGEQHDPTSQNLPNPERSDFPWY